MSEDLSPRKRDWRWDFIKALAASGCVSSACVAAGVSRGRAYRERQRWPKFRKKWDEATRVALDILVSHTRKRALDPDDPHAHVLLMFLLKGLDPRTFRDNGHLLPEEEAEDDEAPLWAEARARLSSEDLDALRAIAEKFEPPAPRDAPEDRRGAGPPVA